MSKRSRAYRGEDSAAWNARKRDHRAVDAALRLQGDRCELCGARPVKLQPVQCVDCGGINAYCADCAEMVAL